MSKLYLEPEEDASMEPLHVVAVRTEKQALGMIDAASKFALPGALYRRNAPKKFIKAVVTRMREDGVYIRQGMAIALRLSGVAVPDDVICEDDQLVNAGEAARLLNCSRQAIHFFVREGKIPCIRIPGRNGLLFPARELHRHAARRCAS
jgi:excisionase family DNA binding protein